MWTTVLVLAIAVNFEPTRIGLVPLMLVRPRPLLQLTAFVCGSLAISLSAGLLVLFVFHHSLIGSNKANGAWVQIAMGTIALLVAAVLATNVSFARKRRTSLVAATVDAAPAEPPPMPAGPSDKMFARVRRLLQRGTSPWLAGVVGLGVGLPSIDYMALLVVIAASGVPPAEQAAGLLTFLAIGHAVVAIPLVSFLIAPSKTRTWVASFQDWIRGRSRRQFAAMLAAVGCVMIALGVHSL